MVETHLADARGAALAELALVLPLLLVLLLGMVDFGKAFNEWIDETHLANEGARLAAVGYEIAGCSNANPNVCLAQHVRDSADLPELRSGRAVDAYADAQNAARVCISYPTNPATNSFGQVGDPVQVTVKATYRWLNYLVNRVSLGETPLLGKATMRLERRADPDATSAPGTETCYPA
jgi:TadE-like protein